jgi:hypothetical protein
MALKNLGDGTVTKLAADANPTATQYPAGVVLQNTDDRKRWISSGTEWILQELPIYKKFTVFKEGATTFVTDKNGRVVQSNTDTQIAVQAQIDTIASEQVYDLFWDTGIFSMNNPILLPSGGAGTIRLIRFFGSNFHPWRTTGGACTRLEPSASFPTNRYFIEGTNTGSTSVLGSHVVIDGFQASNLSNFTTKNVGFVKLECGSIVNGGHTTVIRNIFSEYLWRCIHLIGAMWFGIYENVLSFAGNTSFAGDSVLLLEDGGHTGTINPTPKANDFNRFASIHSAGAMNEFLRMKSGGYNTFRNFFVDGDEYKTAPLNLDNTDTLTTHNNTFKNWGFIDLVHIPSPDNRQAVLYLAGTNVNDNVFREMRMPPYPIALKISGTGVKDNDIEMAAYFGAAATVNDTGANNTNIIRLFPGNNTTGTDTPITHTGGVSTIIDSRRGAHNGGSAFPTGNGSSLTFSFAHSLFKSPAWVSVDPGSANILNNPFWYTWDATNITVTFNTAPPSAQFTLRWKAEAYV